MPQKLLGMQIAADTPVLLPEAGRVPRGPCANLEQIDGKHRADLSAKLG